MKAILKFTLPEEREEFKRMSKADDLCSVLYEFKEWLKKQMDNETETGQYELAWKELFDLMEIHGINLDELWT